MHQTLPLPYLCLLSQNLADSALVKKRAQLDIVDALKPVAKDLDCSLAQLAIAWCAKDPNVSTVITGATKLSQVGGRGLQG